MASGLWALPGHRRAGNIPATGWILPTDSLFHHHHLVPPASQVALVVKNPPGDAGSIPGSGRFPGEGNGNPLQDFRLENPMDGGAWRAIVRGVTKSQDS